MRRASQPDEEEAVRDDGIVQADPIIVDHPAKPDPKLLDTVLKVINSKRTNFSSSNFLYSSLGYWYEIEISRRISSTSTEYLPINLNRRSRYCFS
jgi:hypothetical protein